MKIINSLNEELSILLKTEKKNNFKSIIMKTQVLKRLLKF